MVSMEELNNTNCRFLNKAIIPLFTLSGAIKHYNRSTAVECGLTADDVLKLGL